MNKNFFLIYSVRILIVNFIGIIFLYDTTSFNIGLFSIQSIFYSLNSILLYIFLLIETVFSYLQYYGLDFEFLNLILLDLNNLDYNFASLVILEKFQYLLFFIINLIILINLNFILKFLNKKKISLIKNRFKIFLTFISVTFVFLILPLDLNKKILNKIINFNSTFQKYSIFRNDNWFISFKSFLTYKDNKNFSQKKTVILEDFSKLININKYENIFIIINESYPNFKNKFLKDKLFDEIIRENKNDIIVSNYKKDWSKKYSTQGAELNLFCGNNNNFLDFKKKRLEKFIQDNDCYFKNYLSLNKIFVHSFILNSFNRGRYSGFFDEIYTLDNLKKLNINMCKGSYFAICDHMLLAKIKELNLKKKI